MYVGLGFAFTFRGTNPQKLVYCIYKKDAANPCISNKTQKAKHQVQF